MNIQFTLFWSTWSWARGLAKTCPHVKAWSIGSDDRLLISFVLKTAHLLLSLISQQMQESFIP